MTQIATSLLPLVLALGSCASTTDSALERLVTDIAGKSAVIVRPASSGSVVGREVVDGRPANSILLRSDGGQSLIVSAKSWSERSLTYSNKNDFDVDFSYYIDVTAVPEANFSGKADIEGLVVEDLTDPVPDVQGARLRELVQSDGSYMIDVYRGQLRAATVTFDGKWIKEWGTSVKPAAGLTGALGNVLNVGLDASGKVELSGKGEGSKLVIGLIPARVEVSRRTQQREGAGSSAEVAGYHLSLSEESASAYAVRITSFGMDAKELSGLLFGEVITFRQGGGRSVVLVVDRKNLGSYDYTIQEFTATWVE